MRAVRMVASVQRTRVRSLVAKRANLNLIIPDSYIDPISASWPNRSRMCRVTKYG